MTLTYARFVLIILLVAFLIFCIICLVSELIKKIWGRKKANKFTAFVDNIRDLIVEILSILNY